MSEKLDDESKDDKCDESKESEDDEKEEKENEEKEEKIADKVISDLEVYHNSEIISF